MKAKHQRLTLGIVAVVALIGAALLAMSALKDEAAYFYSPADVQRAGVPVGQAIRLGGMVADKSIKHEADGVTISFVVRDGDATVPVRFKGIVPDLFKENSGVVAEGRFADDGTFVADNILAKHDERYMPPQLEGNQHKTGKVE
ncbi:cytochrome c maturation protein CcmE [Sphingomonas sp. C3-2]|uniref:cytochrome c maturation protein CcmE n=1 Tax=Sphingomonas sp. C3-2 TaxID=3062169 RepID=UPI00294B674C|nr:cytochrome c maturation protein CcmE [Sphingomonas sp. C3-2]WOK36819.1 cytochrome c maturation protein CcmE [Sphingomonas sp. C3-2]